MRAIVRMLRRLLPLVRRAAPVRRPPGNDGAAEFDLELTASSTITIVDAAGRDHCVQPGVVEGRYGVALAPGHAFVTPPIAPGQEHVLRVAALVGAANRAATIRIELAPVDGGAASVVASLSGLGTTMPPRQLQVSLAHLAPTAQRFRIVAEPTNGASVFLVQLQIGALHRLGRLHAFSGYEQRVKNEVQHFSGASYTHAMYGEQPAGNGTGVVREAEAAAAAGTSFAMECERRARATLAALTPVSGEATFNYSMRALGSLLPMSKPDFLARADQLGVARPLRMLSLCSGAARVEEQILARSTQPIHLTLLDASRDLIQRAADRLATAGRGHSVDCLIGDVNRGLPGVHQYDVIVCVSALHHIADLEVVLSQINVRLTDDGEFWSIGEQIGRNGNRLWPDAYVAANRVFGALPARLRRNKITGAVDEAISDADFSIGCFEGIRSEELEALLEAHLVPMHVYKRNAFLWRLVDATYGDNFDLTAPEDLEHLRALLTAEVVHWATGGRSTELHGIYRKKVLVGS